MKKTEDILDLFGVQLFARRPDASKTDYGKLLIIGGSFGMAGAAYLSGLAAFRSGIGMVRFYGPECNRQILQTLLPEAMYTVDRFAQEETGPEDPTGSGIEDGSAQEACAEKSVFDAGRLESALSWADYVICGPGLSQSAYAKAVVRYLFGTDLSDKRLVLLDADALNIISAEKLDIRKFSSECCSRENGRNLVLTPHMGEMSRLTGKTVRTLKRSPQKAAKEFAFANQCTVVLKDAVSYVAAPDGAVYKNTSGSPALAKAGSGDVLTGVIAGITAVTGGKTEYGAVIGTFLHGKAGEMAEMYCGVHSVLARDVADAVSSVIGNFCTKYKSVFERLDEMMEEDDCFPEGDDEFSWDEDLFSKFVPGQTKEKAFQGGEDGKLPSGEPETENEQNPTPSGEGKMIPFRKKSGKEKT